MPRQLIHCDRCCIDRLNLPWPSSLYPAGEMFRARPAGVWHFSTNCPHWPDDFEEFDDDDSHVGKTCKVCLRLDAVGKSDYEEPTHSISALALMQILS